MGSDSRQYSLLFVQLIFEMNYGHYTLYNVQVVCNSWSSTNKYLLYTVQFINYLADSVVNLYS